MSIACLQGIQQAAAPSAMLQSLVDACRQISAEAEAGGAALPSADELMPLVAYVLLRAQVPSLPSVLAMLQELATDAQLSGEQGYCLATFQASDAAGGRRRVCVCVCVCGGGGVSKEDGY